MHSIRFRLLCAALSILTAMLACNMPFAAPPVPVTSTATIPATRAPTEPPTDTATPAVTATKSLTPEPSSTPTTEAPVAEVVKESNCRIGPGGMYELVLTFKAGDSVEIVARDLGGGFVFVKNPKDPEQGCWMLQNNLTISGNITPLPAYTPPPSPTLAPNFTVEFKNYDNCRGVFTRFIVVNTGNLGFRSAYVKVTNLKNKEVTEHVVSAFDLTLGCIVAQNIAPLGPGKTGYLQSDVFNKDPKGQKMVAVFQLCTEQGLKGACVTQTLEFSGK
jgi:hypothetical protein